MPTVITSPAGTIESMLDHSWLADDLKAAFGAAPFVANTTSVSDYLASWLTSSGYNSERVRSGLYVQDAQVTACLMNQALEFLQRTLCNTIAHYMLARSGLETWARVTNYYAGYFCVHSLLCLQGRTITRLQLDRAVLVQIVPVDLRNHVFGITNSHLSKNPHHEIPWRRFYQIYDRYAVPHQAYELVARKAYVTNPTDESTERNAINYTPFVGFTEIRNLIRHQEFSTLFVEYISKLEQKSTLEEFLIDLQGFASDPDHKYFARTLLKLALAGDILLALPTALYNHRCAQGRCQADLHGSSSNVLYLPS
ncbi:MAG: hypothetical protein HY268_04135 [Deltaproteobacteria bacterium]|nr:hypothetical protein [Deltaproteobacteria bacterium]